MPHAQKEIPLLKIAILVLLMALLISLGSGFYFLMTDQGDRTKRHTLHSLGVRLGIGIVLLGVIIYSIASGQLGNRNPWDVGPGPATTTQGN
jgi:protein-S-isoprenylcysteine O-methyltransferase Ste14